MLAGLFDWSLAAYVCQDCLITGIYVWVRAPSPCCGQDVIVRIEGACCKVTCPHTYTAVPWGTLRSAAVFPWNGRISLGETSQRLDVGLWWEEGKGKIRGKKTSWKALTQVWREAMFSKGDGKQNRSFRESWQVCWRWTVGCLFDLSGNQWLNQETQTS